jgi:hypothetical protein
VKAAQADTPPLVGVDHIDFYSPNPFGYEVLQALRAWPVKTLVSIATGDSGLRDLQTIPYLLGAAGSSLRLAELKTTMTALRYVRFISQDDRTTGSPTIASLIGDMRQMPSASDPLQGYEHYGRAGWDGHDAEPITEATLKYARWFLGLFPETLGPPDIAPSADGSIGLEWVPEDSLVQKLFLDIGPGQQWRAYWTTREGEFARRAALSFDPNTKAILKKLFEGLTRVDDVRGRR